METTGTRQDSSIDRESLGRVCRYVDELYTKRALEASSYHEDSDDLISLGDIDIETVRSMEKFIHVLAKDDERLAHELEDAVLQQHALSTGPNIRHETLSSIGKYLDVISKTNGLGMITDSVDEDDNSTLPGTVILENEHPDMLKSIANYIDYTLESKTAKLHQQINEYDNQDYPAGRLLKNATTDDCDSDNISQTSSQLLEFQNNDGVQEVAEIMEEASITDNDTTSQVGSDDLTAQISPETLSQIGAFIDLVAQRNKKIVPSKSNIDELQESEHDYGSSVAVEEIAKAISDDLSMADNGISSQRSDDTSLALDANPDLLASVEAYIDNLAKANAQGTIKMAKLAPEDPMKVEDHLEQLDLDGGKDDDITIEIRSQKSGMMDMLNYDEQGREAITSHIVQQRDITHHQMRNASFDPPADFISVRSDDDDECNCAKNISRHRRDPELSGEPLFDTTGEQVRSDDNENISKGYNSRPRRDPELSKIPVFDTTGEHVRTSDGDNNVKENRSLPRRDPELSKTPIFGTTDEQIGSANESWRPRRDPESSRNPDLVTIDEQTGSYDDKSNYRESSWRPRIFRDPDVDITDEQTNSEDSENVAKENVSRHRCDLELSRDPNVDITDKQVRSEVDQSENIIHDPVLSRESFPNTSSDQIRPRNGLGGPEMRSTDGRIGKGRNAVSNENEGCQIPAEELLSDNSRKENKDISPPRMTKRHPPSPEKKNHRKGNQTKNMFDEEDASSAIIHVLSDQIHDLTSNSTPSEVEAPRHESEPKEKYPPGTETSFIRDIRNLTIMITGTKRPSLSDETIVKRFVFFCRPLVEEKEPSAASVSKIMCKAGELGLPLDAADRFLSLAQAVLDDRRQHIEIEAAPSDEVRSSNLSSLASFASDASQGFEAFVSRLVDVGAEDPQFMLPIEEDDANYDSDDGKAYVDIRVSSGSGGDDGADAIEVDLLCGALVSNYERNGYDHWQTFAAKLLMSDSGNDFDAISSTSSDCIDKPPSRTLSEPPIATSLRQQDDEKVEVATNFSVADVKPKRLMQGINESLSDETEDTFDRHIMQFWKEQQSARRKRFGYPSRTVKSLADSYSQDDNDTVSFITASHASSYDLIEDAWIMRRSMAMYGMPQKMSWNKSRKLMVASVQPPKPINAVNATARFFHCGSFLKRSKIDPLTNVWRETYVDRTAAHSGYLDVHVKSLYAATSCLGERDPRDSLPWENRPVKQRFLHEQSVSLCKNWFGVLIPKKRNQVVDQPVCRPDSFPMPVAAGEWTEEWYQKKVLPPIQSNLSGSVDPAALDPIDFFPEEDYEDESLFDKVPQCGRIRNVKLKIGEKITRVTPDLTSSLRRSRWRKRHFPRGTFPYK